MINEIKFPVITYHVENPHLHLVSSHYILSKCTRLALKKKYFEDLYIISSDGNEYRVIEAKKKSIDWKSSGLIDLISFNPFLIIDLVFDQNYKAKRDVAYLQEKLLLSIEDDRVYWEDLEKREVFVKRIELVKSVEHIIEIMDNYY